MEREIKNWLNKFADINADWNKNTLIKWKPIKGFEDKYYISTEGNVFCMKTRKEIKPHLHGVSRRNYHQVTLYAKNRKKTARIHALMAITFLGMVYGDRKIMVDHIDNNPLNNTLGNLRIVTAKANNWRNRIK